MRNILWRLWLRLSGQKYPSFRGDTLRNPFGTGYTYAPEEIYVAWDDGAGNVTYGKWPPLLGGE